MKCSNCGEPIVWVPDHGGRWTHYRADKVCGHPEPEEPRFLETLDADERGGR